MRSWSTDFPLQGVSLIESLKQTQERQAHGGEEL